MLETTGFDTVDELFGTSIPGNVRLNRPLNLPAGTSEYELIRHMRNVAADNADLTEYVSFLGAGAYDHFIPSIVDAIISLPEFNTPYTPYQAEVSQGILQSLFEYQTMISELTGLDIANASLYDGSTAMAEAALLAHDVTGNRRIIVSGAVHPEYRAVLKTYTMGIGATIETVSVSNGATDTDALEELADDGCACIIVQQPNFFGYLENVDAISAIAARYPALLLVSFDPVSLGILKPPAEYGADVVTAEGQLFGNSLSFGGPYLGVFACRGEYLRRVPGHLISATNDTAGRTGYVLTLQTREQHIKRERATSNICTCEVLNAIAAAVHLSYLGPNGLREVATQCTQKAHYAFEQLKSIDYLEPLSDAPFFKEFAFKSSRSVPSINERLYDKGIIGGFDIGRVLPEHEDTILFCVTEKRTKDEIDTMVRVMRSL
jgi:glycine dehydrogenase subunit 1